MEQLAKQLLDDWESRLRYCRDQIKALLEAVYPPGTVVTYALGNRKVRSKIEFWGSGTDFNKFFVKTKGGHTRAKHYTHIISYKKP